VPLQYHVHAPSEHTIDGYSCDLEMHFVHLYEDGSLGAVIGVMFDRLKGGNHDNFMIEQMLPIFETAPNVKQTANQDQFIGSFLHSLDYSEFWSYDGSLTTPPCTEGIKWSVLKTVQPISDRQI
jgi:carbonic anhydrase